MRLVTRADFDGLACAVLLNRLGLIDEYKFVHPKDVQDGLVDVSENDILTNVPYAPGCGMWFDHHSSEKERLGQCEFVGSSKLGPSCARVIWDYYRGYDKFPKSLDPMLEAVDKVDSAALSAEEILHPSGWVLLGMIMDPRTGLGHHSNFRIGNWQLMMDMIDYCGRMSAEEILAVPDVRERAELYFSQQEKFAEMLRRNATVTDNVLVVDLRHEAEIYTGNRFMVYALWPDINVSVQIIWGLEKKRAVLTVGQSILNRTCTADVGSLMLRYGGGGHRRVGTCQIAPGEVEAVLAEVVEALRGK